MHGLPSEVLTKVLQYLNREDLQTCFLVCKSWHLLTIPLLWKEVTIASSGIELLKSQFKENDYKKYFKYGHFIKKLTLFDIYDGIANRFRPKLTRTTNFTKEEFLMLLDQLNNLIEIDIRNSDQIGVYLTYLLDANLTNINKILANPEYNQNVYFSVCYKFRASISYLNLRYDKKTGRLGGKDTDIVDILREFEHLETLEFHNGSDYNLTPLQILESCPNLKDLSFSSDYPISEDIAQDFSRINLNSFKSLLHLKLEIPPLSNSYTQYLITYFPEQLETLQIYISNQNLFDWIDTVKIENALKLLDKISKFQGTSISFQSSSLYEMNDESRMTSFFQLLYALKKNRNLYLDITSEGLNENNSSIWQFKNGSDGYMHIIYKIYEDGFNQNTNFLKLPKKCTFTVGLEILSKLNIDLFRHDEDVFYHVLEYALEYCPNLEELNLTWSSYDESSSFNDDSISTIRYANTKNHKPCDVTRNDIDLLEIAFISSAQSFFQLINNYLPNIETLVFGDGDIIDQEIDLTDFKKLKLFTYRIEDCCSEIKEDKIILFKYANEEWLYFCYEKIRDQIIRTQYNECLIPDLTIVCDKSVVIKFLRNDKVTEFVYE